MVWIIGIIVLFLLSGLKVVNQYERGVLFTLGKYKGILKPGLRLVIPIIQSWKRVDMRVKAVDVPEQESITKDNITVGINAVIYYKVSDSTKAIIEVENFFYAVTQLAQTTMRNIVGEVELDELLSQRDKISTEIKKIVDNLTDPWGIKVDSVELKDITLAPEMKRVIGKQAEAEREKRAVIIKAEGEVAAANNMASAAKTLGMANGALHLRTLQAINNLASDKSNTVVLGIPLEILRAFEEKNK
ncbi:MAG: slipin family protein [Candidatus Woesearchaeota archaeon]